MAQSQSIILYELPDQNIQLHIPLTNDSVWLTQEQMSQLFDVNRTVISRHISSILKTKEVEEKSNVQKMHVPNSDRPVKIYGLDLIISVGYRVNSKLATQFRIWATKVLRDHILKGYTFNRHRLPEISWDVYDQTVAMIKSASKKKLLPTAESMALLDIIARYTKSFVLLQQVDTDTLPETNTTKARVELEQSNLQEAINQLKTSLIARRQASDLFGTQRSQGFSQVIGSIYQTFDGQDLYPSIEEKASHLLYFIIKDHPFVDGNKRIGSLLFVWFLEKNSYLRKKNGETKINDNALVTLALLIAESKPKDKELMIRLVTHLLSE